MYKYLTANNTHTYINALKGMLKKYNNTIHSAIKMKPIDATLNENITKVFNALYEDYEPKYPYYKFNVGDKVSSTGSAKLVILLPPISILLLDIIGFVLS